MDNSTPEFRWADRCYSAVDSLLEGLWGSLRRQVKSATARHPFVRGTGKFIFGIALCGAYICAAFLWGSACYVFFPIFPYTLWDVVAWVFMAGFLLISGIFGVYSLFFGFVFLGYLLRLLLWSVLSLFNLFYVVIDATRTRAKWVIPYRSILIACPAGIVALATYADGTSRFWDQPFEFLPWFRLCFFGLSLWSALFCLIARDRVVERETPRRISLWTLGILLVLGTSVFWQRDSGREYYFLHKAVEQNSQDREAWLDLANFYYSEGDRLASENGDENNPPPNPVPAYREALRCFDRAAELGATGFELNEAWTELADLLGDRHSASSYAQIALRFEPSDGEPDETRERVIWLPKIIERENEPSTESERRNRVRRLPIFVRWVFESADL